MIRQIQTQDYPEVLSWFAERKWPQPPVENIAPIVGFVCEDNGELQACVWAYFTGRSIAFIEWSGTNPSIPEEEGTKALHRVVDAMKEYCDHMSPPVKALCFFTQNDKLADHFKKMSFKKNEGYHRLMWVSR